MAAHRRSPSRCSMGWCPEAASAYLGSEVLVEDLLEHHRLVVLCVACAVHERHVATPSSIEQRHECILMRCELRTVATLKLVPPFWVVTEPLPEPSAGRDFFWPGSDVQLVFSYASRPDAIHQEPRAVVTSPSIVRASEPDHMHVSHAAVHGHDNRSIYRAHRYRLPWCQWPRTFRKNVHEAFRLVRRSWVARSLSSRG